MSTYFSRFASSAIVALSIAVFIGCSSETSKEPAAEEHHEGDGHDHEGEHRQGDGHDHSKKGAAHDHDGGAKHEHAHLAEADLKLPTEFSPAVARIKVCHDSMREALVRGAVHEAHRPADELVILAGKLMPLARDGGVPKAQWKQINLLAKELGARLEALHDAIDRDQTTGYDSILTAVDKVIADLQAVSAGMQNAARQEGKATVIGSRKGNTELR